MKKLILTTIFISSWSFAYCQINISELERVNGLWTKKGEKDPYSGDFKETFENGDIKGIGTLVKGQLEGLRIQYHANGKKRTEKEYKAAYPHGISKEFYEDGTMKQEVEMGFKMDRISNMISKGF